MGGSTSKSLPPSRPAVNQSPRNVVPNLCPQRDLLLAIGIIGTPRFIGRRMAIRESLMRWPNVGHHSDAEVCAAFIVRAGGAPKALQLEREARTQGDMLLVESVAWNETRIRGPSLSLAWWLNYARAELKQARFIAKVDDDTYLHAPDLGRLLRHIESTLGANSNVYLGALTFCHWYPKLFDMTQHALTLRGALNAGKWCRKNELAWVNPEQGGAGRCEGPFPSAPGYLIVLSSSLVGEISAGLHADADRLRNMNPSAMRNRLGRQLELIYEDAWLGSVLHRFPPKRPVNYLLLPTRSPRMYVELTFNFRVARSALLTHVRSKRPEHYLAAHAFTKDHELHCSRVFQLECERRCNFATLPPHDGPCVKENQWCTVSVGEPQINSTGCCPHSFLHDRRDNPIHQKCALGDGSNDSIFGSDRWASPFQPLAQKLLSRRFERVATRKQLRVPGQAWLAVASEARAAYYTKLAKARSLQRPLVSAKPGLKTFFIPE